MKTLQHYLDMRLLDIHAQQVEDWDTQGATHVRVVLPANSETEYRMQQKGYMLADRTLAVSINLGRSTLDFDKLVRMQIVESEGYRDDILRIAKASFTEDRRFHILPHTDAAIAGAVLGKWVDELKSSLICLYKDTPVGFLSLRETGEDSCFVHLAAVEEKYRMTGAALSLYAKAASLVKEKGFRKLEGRISSRNTAVMNLYAYLGAAFSDPEDVYLKEVEAK